MRLASARDVAKLGKLRTDLAIRQPLSFELLGQCDGFRHALGIALAAFALTVGLPLAISGRLKLSDQPRLFELRERTCNLAHSDFHVVAGFGQIIAIDRYHPHAKLD